MVRSIIIGIILIMTIGFGQPSYKAGGEVRLSPRLLNYQGYLTDTLGNPITNPSVSMTFAIFDAASSGNQKWTETQSAVSVNKGIFHVLLGTVTPIPDSVFTASINRYLQLTVGGQALSPRTQIVSAPYAYTSTYSDTAVYARNSAPDNDWTYHVSDGADTTLQMDGRWGLARSGNILYGTADSTHVNLGVGNTTGASGYNYKYCTVSGGYYNTAGNQAATIGGGRYNTADSIYASVGGGYYNTASGFGATVSGGYADTAIGYGSTVCGGRRNNTDAIYATVAGGYENAALGYYAAIGGGRYNNANMTYGTVSGGFSNLASSFAGTVSGGYGDTAMAYYGGALSGYGNLAGDAETDTGATVCGGFDNTAVGRYSHVGGGRADSAGGEYSVVGGGYRNRALGDRTTVSGGYLNWADSAYATIGGGRYNWVRGCYSTVGGGNECFAIDSCTTVGGGYYNIAEDKGAAIGGGVFNVARGEYGVVAGGRGDTAMAIYSASLSGHCNKAGEYDEDTAAVVCGGTNNTASGKYSFIGGGYENIASGPFAAIAGGWNNDAQATYGFSVGFSSSVDGGDNNSAAFNGMQTLASGQTRVGILSKASGTFSIDHPLDPENKVLNHYFVESPGMTNIYEGEAVLDGSGRAEIVLPAYFDALNRAPRIQLTGVGTSDVYVAEKVNGNRFVIGGKPGTEVFWMVTADRKDQSAEITRILMPVEQSKKADSANRSLDDQLLVSTMTQLERMGKASGFKFRHASEQKRYEKMKRMIEGIENK